MNNFAIEPEQLAQLMGTLAKPVLLDVRKTVAFEASPQMLASAQRCLPEEVAQWAAAPLTQEVVVYCVYGHQVSQTAAAQLRAKGYQARYLAGACSAVKTVKIRRKTLPAGVPPHCPRSTNDKLSTHSYLHAGSRLLAQTRPHQLRRPSGANRHHAARAGG